MGFTPKYRSLRGMPDILPKDSELMNWVEEKARKVYKIFGYGEIRTPFLEETELFTRSIGEDTDIVGKEMYSFIDRGKKSISLRPEGTASIIRAYIENGLNNSGLVKLFYFGPMFRGERPQKGRLRQFHQIGAEIIGGADPYMDAELIMSLNTILKDLKVEGYTILLNSLGCSKDREIYKKTLSQYLSEKEDDLCDDCKRRRKTNVLRVLDCKREGCKEVVKDAPAVINSLCCDCMEKYEGLKSILVDRGIEFTEKKDLVRGLDYYTGTVFEVIHPSLGAQDAIAAGGRYDDLTKLIGGPDVGAIGYAIGIERLLLTVDKKKIDLDVPGILVIPMKANYRQDVFRIVDYLRRKGIPCEVELTGRSFKGQMRKADKDKRKFVVIIGEDEVHNRKLLVKNMESGEQDLLTFDDAVEKFKNEFNC